jgi:hypothetical protein
MRPAALARQSTLLCSTLFLVLSVALAEAQSLSAPPPIVPDAWHAEHVTYRVVPGRPGDVRAWLESRQIISFFPKTDKLPAITKVEVLTPEWFKTGGQRRVTFADGTSVSERVVAYEKPKTFRYQIWGFTSAARFTVDYIVGEFAYTEEAPDKTRITWTYRIKPKYPLLSWPVSSFLNGTFKPIMEGAMDNVAAARRNS